MLTKCVVLISLCGALVAPTAQANVFNMAPGLTSVQFVAVGNPGNAPDTRYNGFSLGSVDHVYQMGKYEITAGQYTEFLNAVAKADPNELYNPATGDPSGDPNGAFGANIQRIGSSPNFSYSVASDWANRPVNYVSLWDAARFANWLQNGQPTGPQGPATTESGAYHDIGDQTLFGRSVGARFFVPNQNEWYNAAYHNNSAGLAASYFDFPTGSNTVPINALPDPGNHSNFLVLDATGKLVFTIGGPYYRTVVGAFVNSASPYGTFDQGGNVWEWTETPYTSLSRNLLGGAFGTSSFYMQASSRGDPDVPSSESSYFGFRIAAAVPQPNTGVLAVLASGGIWWGRKRLIA